MKEERYVGEVVSNWRTRKETKRKLNKKNEKKEKTLILNVIKVYTFFPELKTKEIVTK